MTTCIFHTDPDGALSAAVVGLAHPDATFICMNYGWKLPIHRLAKGETVYVVDFTCTPEEMQTLKDNFNLVWIDHHTISIKQMADLGIHIEQGKREVGKAGCLLTWEYLFPDKPVPLVIDLVGRYDVGQAFNDADAMSLISFLRNDKTYLYPHTGQEYADRWKALVTSDDLTRQCTEKGRPAYEFVKQHNESSANFLNFETMFEGHIALAANVANVDPSIFFASLVKPARHAIVITFYWHRKGYWKFSVRQVDGHPTPVDVGELCKKHGGGGHTEAGAFLAYPGKFPLVLDPFLGEASI